MDLSIAIVVIAYNRNQSLCRLLSSLNIAYYSKKVTLYISIDKGDNQDVVDSAKTFEWIHGDKILLLHNHNLGLRKHILSCGSLLEKHDAIVVLEDDIVVSRYFYDYSLRTVQKYNGDNNVAGISLYGFQTIYHNSKPFIPKQSEYDIYFMQNAQSWGQIWMKRQWEDFIKWYDSNNDEFYCQPHLPESICQWKKSSWLKYHTKYCIENNKYFVYPYISFSSNAGESGTHASFSSPLFIVPLRDTELKEFKLPSLKDDVIKYDSFFENQLLHNYFGFDDEDICVDLNGLKKNREGKRYWLTLQPHKYKVVLSFGLNMRPIEDNILYSIAGESIFLYDTTKKANKPKVDSRKSFFFMNGYDLAHVSSSIKEVGIHNYLKMMISIALKKVLFR